MTINQAKLEEFVGKMLQDLGAAVNSTLVLIGDRLGLYRAIADYGSVNSTKLAELTDISERYAREWLAAQAASGYIDYDAQTEQFQLNPAQIAVFVDEDSPTYMIGGFYSLASVASSEPKLEEAFRSGEGISWGDHSECLFCGTAKFFRPTYKTYLTSQWLPSLKDAIEKLEKGAKVADVGCGHGCSTAIMAEAFPNSEFYGFDFHEPSIMAAREQAQAKGLKNVSFAVTTAKTYPGNDYDLVAFFDCLHDMGDPVGAIAHVKETLKPDGTLMLVEPFAGDRLTDNLNTLGRVMYGFSTTVCTPSSLSQEVGLALGAQAGEKRLREVVTSGGFSRFRRANETQFNFILEARI
ncbi:MAG: class I SAM-dependent methyltransferase [Pleurocapsa sp. MO_226.B13]|nr:class I SAM-dependent methyltransferase [Pleurocapsa sp. MO_226.B13]